MSQNPEILEGTKLLGTVRGVIDSRRVCKMEIPNTRFSWITLILGMESIKGSHFLLIDKVAGFEKALSQSPNREIAIDFIESDGVPCYFKTWVVGLRPDALTVEMPESILRMQKRRFYRVKARLGTELSFRPASEEEEKAIVRDYSMGGVAFFMERHLDLHEKTQVSDIELKIPQAQQWLSFYNPIGEILRIEPQASGKDICVLEFMSMSEPAKERLWRHIFEEQRMLLKKTKLL